MMQVVSIWSTKQGVFCFKDFEIHSQYQHRYEQKIMMRKEEVFSSTAGDEEVPSNFAGTVF